MLAKDGSGRFGEFVQVDAQATLELTKTLRRRVRQARQAVEAEISLVLAEALRRRVRQARQAVEVKPSSS